MFELHALMVYFQQRLGADGSDVWEIMIWMLSIPYVYIILNSISGHGLTSISLV